jgi:O-antigen/teichoic acid export membrane protein
MLLGITAGAGILWLLRASVISLLFGGQYDGSEAVLAILAAVLPLLAFSIAAVYLLSLRGRMQHAASAYAGAVVVSLILNALLASRLGAVGTALAKLGSQIVLAALLSLCLHRTAVGLPRFRIVLAMGVAVAACSGLSLMPDPTGGWIRGLAFLLLFGVLGVAGGVIERHELTAIRHLVRVSGQTLEPARTVVR